MKRQIKGDTALISRVEGFERRAVLQTVERLGVALQNLVGLGLADPALVRLAADFVQRAQIGGDLRHR